MSNKNREVSNFATLILAPSQRNLRIFAHGRRRFMVVGAPRRELGTPAGAGHHCDSGRHASASP